MREVLPSLAGLTSSTIFIVSCIPQLAKALRTKDMRSYSGVALLLLNVGNGIHWVYIASLPLGPIYLLHGWSTVSTLVLWWCFWRYGRE